MFEKLIGQWVHFPDSSGNLHEGTIVAAWREKKEGIRIAVQCKNNRFCNAWLENVTAGPVIRPRELQGGI